eukprot:gene10295-2712_t
MNPSKQHFETEYTTLSGYGLKLLQKQGFKTGDGLGKNRDGVTEFVRQKKKQDNLGIGATNTNSNNWWEKLYDSTVSKNVKVDDDKIEKKKKKEKKEKKSKKSKKDENEN